MITFSVECISHSEQIIFVLNELQTFCILCYPLRILPTSQNCIHIEYWMLNIRETGILISSLFLQNQTRICQTKAKRVYSVDVDILFEWGSCWFFLCVCDSIDLSEASLLYFQQWRTFINFPQNLVNLVERRTHNKSIQRIWILDV